MKKIKELISNIPESFTFSKTEGFLILGVATMFGIILGMLISPRKNQRFGCNNGNYYYSDADDDKED